MGCCGSDAAGDKKGGAAGGGKGPEKKAAPKGPKALKLADKFKAKQKEAESARAELEKEIKGQLKGLTDAAEGFKPEECQQVTGILDGIKEDPLKAPEKIKAIPDELENILAAAGVPQPFMDAFKAAKDKKLVDKLIAGCKAMLDPEKIKASAMKLVGVFKDAKGNITKDDGKHAYKELAYSYLKGIFEKLTEFLEKMLDKVVPLVPLEEFAEKAKAEIVPKLTEMFTEAKDAAPDAGKEVFTDDMPEKAFEAATASTQEAFKAMPKTIGGEGITAVGQLLDILESKGLDKTYEPFWTQISGGKPEVNQTNFVEGFTKVNDEAFKKMQAALDFASIQPDIEKGPQKTMEGVPALVGKGLMPDPKAAADVFTEDLKEKAKEAIKKSMPSPF